MNWHPCQPRRGCAPAAYTVVVGLCVQAAVGRAKEQLLGLHEELEALLQAQAEAGKA